MSSSGCTFWRPLSGRAQPRDCVEQWRGLWPGGATLLEAEHLTGLFSDSECRYLVLVPSFAVAFDHTGLSAASCGAALVFSWVWNQLAFVGGSRADVGISAHCSGVALLLHSLGLFQWQSIGCPDQNMVLQPSF